MSELLPEGVLRSRIESILTDLEESKPDFEAAVNLGIEISIRGIRTALDLPYIKPDDSKKVE